MKHRAISILVLAALFFFSAGTAHAQAEAFNSDISVSTIPENPGPNQSVTISLSSFSISTKSADIRWSVDGRGATGGVGRDTFTFTTKDVGASTSIAITITPVGSIPIRKNIVIVPETADLLWQATDSIVPPFYRGKAMPTSESDIRFVAIPNIRSTGGIFPPSSILIYNWKEDDDNNAAASGYGKDSYAVTMDYLNPAKRIDVQVSSLDGSVTAETETTITPASPKVLWYASSPLYGPLYNTALGGTYTVSGSETSLFAEPYFFSTDSDSTFQTLKYEWQLNGQAIATPNIPNALLLHRDDTATGSATVDVTVTNVTKLFQELSAHLDLSLQ